MLITDTSLNILDVLRHLGEFTRHHNKKQPTLRALEDTRIAFEALVAHADGKVTWLRPDKRAIKTSWAKFLIAFNKELLAKDTNTSIVPPAWSSSTIRDITPFTETEIQTWQAELTNYYAHEGLVIDEVKGDDLIPAYACTESCMKRSPALQLYAQNPDRVSLLVVSRKEKRFARALKWVLDDGTVFLDRIYPSDGGAHISFLKAHAAKQGWGYKEDQAIDGDNSDTCPNIMSVTLKDVGAYPYMDTLYLVKPMEGTLLLRSEVTAKEMLDFYELRDTDNYCPWEGIKTAPKDDEDDGEDTPNDTIVYGLAINNKRVTSDNVFDYVFSDREGCYIPIVEAIFPYNTSRVYHRDNPPSRLFATLEGAWVDPHSPMGLFIQVNTGLYSGEWVHELQPYVVRLATGEVSIDIDMLHNGNFAIREGL